MTEINGFKIAKYNIHNLPDGVKYSTCPLCSAERKKKTQKCLSIHWDSGLAKCSHCGEVIQLHEFENKNKEVNYKIPEWSNETKLSDKVVKWFEGRGISQFVLRLMKIGEGVHFMPPNSSEEKGRNKNTIQFPYFRNGQIVDIKYRAGDKTFNLFKGAERMAYNLDNIQGQEVIYCVEGEPDVLAVMECGIHNVCSPPNGFTEKGNVNLDWLNNDVEHFINAKKIILAFDQDKPGRNGTNEFIRRFGAHKCFLVDLKDCKDSNDYLLAYGKESLKITLENHIEIPLDNVSAYNDHKKDVRDFFINGMPKGIVTKTMGNLDNWFSVNLGQTIMVTGIPSMGKSEVVDQITLSWAMNYDFKIAFASPENKPNVLHHQKLIRKLLGSVPKNKSDFNQSFEACEDFIQNHVTMIDADNGYDLEKVLLKAEELVYRKGINVLVLDPFNKIPYKGNVESITGNRVNDYTAKYHQLINQFETRFNVIVILVAHPVKMQKQESGKYLIPTFYDIKGGGEHYDMSHHGLVVHRDYDLGLTMMGTLKVKFQHLGENNKEFWFKYHVESGRLCNVIGEPVGIDGYKIEWDYDNWITKMLNKTNQKEIFNNNEDLEKNKDFFDNPKIEEDVPF